MKYLNGYAEIVDYIHRRTGILYSNEAIRKIIHRDAIMKKARSWFNSIPRLPESVVAEWVKRVSGRKRRNVA